MSEMLMRKLRSTAAGQIGLFVTNQISDEDMSMCPMDKDLLVSYKTPRNPKQHALAWALAQILADSCDFLHDKEDGMEFLKFKARHVRYIADPKTGQLLIIPKSIAFASLSQQAFSRFLNRAIWVVCNEIIPGLEEGPLRTKLEEMTAPR